MVRVFSQYVSPKSIVLMVLEGFLIALALLCAARIRFWGSASAFDDYTACPDFAWQAVVFVATLQICFYYCDLYRLNTLRTRNEQWMAIAQSLGSGCLLLGLVYFVFPSLVLGRGIFFISVALVPAFVTFNRRILDRVWMVAGLKESIVIIGAGDLAVTVASQLLKRNDLNVKLAGFFDMNSATSQDELFGRPVFGPGEGLQSVVERHQVSRIIVALEDRRNVMPTRDLVRLRVQGLRIEDAHSTISSLTGRVWLETVKPSWFVFTEGFRRSILTLVLKRVIDLVSGVIGLIVTLPVMFLVAAVVRLDSKGPVIFRQRRVGLGGKCFELMKFRSMRVDAEEGTGAQWATSNDPRMTRAGRFLRKYRLDELPQFVNVIRGEMSLVGPRPERPEFVDELRKHISYYDERHSVRPGITGWAQVQYRYGSNFEDAVRKLEYDLFYLKNMSIFFDCIIILDTVRIVMTGDGAR